MSGLHKPCASSSFRLLLHLLHEPFILCHLQGLENQAYDVNQFVTAWAELWKKVSCLPNFQTDIAQRVFIDVMNEPDSMNIVWEPSSGRPGAHQLYLGTADALWQLTPGKVMFFMEGEWNVPLCIVYGGMPQLLRTCMALVRNCCGDESSPNTASRSQLLYTSACPVSLSSETLLHLISNTVGFCRDWSKQFWAELGQWLHY